MIDHWYKIVTREVAMTESRAKYFIAELSDVHLIVDGERIAAQYPRQAFSGKTQASAMLLANDMVRIWLGNQSRQLSISVADRATLPK
jgi:hypothetical protein